MSEKSKIQIRDVKEPVKIPNGWRENSYRPSSEMSISLKVGFQIPVDVSNANS